MFCQYCGKQINNDAVFCPYCGRKQQTYSGGQSGPSPRPSIYQDYNNVGFNILSFFFPIVGLILFCVWHTPYPQRSHGIGVWSLIGVGVRIVIYVAIIVGVMVFGVHTMSSGTYSTPSNSF